jgi:pilus assembly protein CpaD
MHHPLHHPLAVAAASILALALVGCGETQPPGTVSVDYQAPVRDVVKIESHNASFTVFLDLRTGTLAAPERQRLAAFVGQFGGDRPEAIHAEIRGTAAFDGLAAVADAMVAQGVERTKLTLLPGQPAAVVARPGTQAVTIAATRAVAVLPSCPGWVDHPSAPADNLVAPNFGCSDVSNLASMVADPADLLKGQGAHDSDGTVAASAVEHYRTDTVKALPAAVTTTLGGGASASPSSGGGAGGGTGQ